MTNCISGAVQKSFSIYIYTTHTLTGHFNRTSVPLFIHAVIQSVSQVAVRDREDQHRFLQWDPGDVMNFLFLPEQLSLVLSPDRLKTLHCVHELSLIMHIHIKHNQYDLNAFGSWCQMCLSISETADPLGYSHTTVSSLE